jgi:hypothetical protein
MLMSSWYWQLLSWCLPLLQATDTLQGEKNNERVRKHMQQHTQHATAFTKTATFSPEATVPASLLTTLHVSSESFLAT